MHLALDGDKKGYKEGDKVAADEAVKYLATGAADVVFVYFGHVDSTGHGYGFHPKSPKYTNAIEEADGHLGRVLDAIEKRQTRKQEDWLVVVTTDHGGKGRGHFPGVKEPEIRTGFLIVSGVSARKEKLKEKTATVDVVPTILSHLGVPIDPEWKLDGQTVGLESGGSRKK
jgi:bisphosphoglycerate-independent phosphoglycerate mutase (AlkP superfamily)